MKYTGGSGLSWRLQASQTSRGIERMCDPRIVHIKSGGFTTADVIDRDGAASPPDGLSVALERDVRSVRFSPDGLCFAFLSEKRLGCLRTMQPEA